LDFYLADELGKEVVVDYSFLLYHFERNHKSRGLFNRKENISELAFPKFLNNLKLINGDLILMMEFIAPNFGSLHNILILPFILHILQKAGNGLFTFRPITNIFSHIGRVGFLQVF
jgi:hypothetical protein